MLKDNERPRKDNWCVCVCGGGGGGCCDKGVKLDLGCHYTLVSFTKTSSHLRGIDKTLS